MLENIAGSIMTNLPIADLVWIVVSVIFLLLFSSVKIIRRQQRNDRLGVWWFIFRNKSTECDSC